jgi:hypothetical protein
MFYRCKTDVTIADRPSGVEILEEDISENPDHYVMVSLDSLPTGGTGQPTRIN